MITIDNYDLYYPVREGTCNRCYRLMYWISCPTGGWWSHAVHPDDDHDGVAAEGNPTEDVDHRGDWHTLPCGLITPENFPPPFDPEAH